MPFYKDQTNKLYYLDSSDFDGLLPTGCIAITDTEADTIRQAAIPVPTTNDMWEKIKSERERRTLTGGYTTGGKWFHSDMLSRSQQIGLVLMGASIPANLQWKTMDGTFVTMTPTLAQQIFAAAGASDMAIFAAAEAHHAAMLASATPWTYDYLSTGWPAMYSGA